MAESKLAERMSDEKCQSSIAELLAKWPLYRKLKFINESVHDYPTNIRTYCPICEGERGFDQFAYEGIKGTRRVQGAFGLEEATTAKNTLRTIHFGCPDCKRHRIAYFVSWKQGKEGTENVIMKCGQSPEIESKITQDLLNSISKQDAELLKKAIRARDFNFGLASVAYLRRVVENQIEPLIEKLLLDKKVSTERFKAKVKKAKADRGFRKILELAGGILPDYLKPNGGQNPLVHLYRLASEGLHNLPEDECIEIFDESLVVFTFVFSELTRHEKEVKTFARGLEKLVKKSTNGS
jgi:hypothetical protein